jgi:hypothetical protein
MYPTVSFGTFLLITVTAATVLLLAWMRSLKSFKTHSIEPQDWNAESLSAKALSEISSNPPNFRSMIDVLQENMSTRVNGTGVAFLGETERQRRMSYVSAREFKSILRSYLWSARLMERGEEK